MSWIARSRTFLGEVRAELKKVTFPSRQEVMATTLVVIITSVIYAAFLWLADEVILQLYQGFNRIFGA